MAVILCQKEATFPYYYERLDISIHYMNSLPERLHIPRPRPLKRAPMPPSFRGRGLAF